ncbi:MAG: hypothetical protein K0R57_2886 [Paenibacillaceae bacterium]|nr:hypothetical protein [Paenibacillaceae bacterium]
MGNRNVVQKARTVAITAIIAWQAGTLQAYANEGLGQKTDYNGHWAEPLVSAALKNGWVQGYEDGSFRPDYPVTRAELAVLLSRAFPGSGGTAVFPDVPGGAWYAQAAADAVAADYLAADSQGLFKPDDAVTRVEAATVLARLLEWDEEEHSGQQSGEDQDYKDESYRDQGYLPEGASGQWLHRAVEEQLILASSDNYILPYKPLTRSEVILALAKVKGTLPHGLKPVADAAERVYEGTLEQSSQGFRITAGHVPDGSDAGYALTRPGAVTLAGTKAVGGESVEVSITAIQGVAEGKLQVLQIEAVGRDKKAVEHAVGYQVLEGVLIEGHHSGLADPKKHTKLCLLMPDCAASGFGIAVLQQDGVYKYYKFDSVGHQLAAALLDSIDKESNIVVRAAGVIEGNGIQVISVAQDALGHAPLPAGKVEHSHDTEHGEANDDTGHGEANNEGHHGTAEARHGVKEADHGTKQADYGTKETDYRSTQTDQETAGQADGSTYHVPAAAGH